MDVARTPAIRRPVRIVTFVGFLTFISVPLVLTLLGMRPGADDNRQPSARPALDARGLVDEQTYQQMDRYLQDSFALRGLAIRINAKLNDEVWKGDTDQVRRGRGDWLYYGPSLSQLCTEAMHPAEGVATLDRFAATIEGEGARFLYTLAPEKTSVYPEYLTDRLAADGRCAFEARDQIRAGLAGQAWYVDLYPAIEQLTSTSAEPLYNPRDTHWTEQGAGVLLERLVDALQPGLWKPEEYTQVGTEAFEPDLTRLLGLGQTIQAPHYVVERPGVTTTEGPAVAVAGTFPIRHFTSTSSSGGAALIPGKTVMFYDSFTIGSIENLAPFFEDVTFIHWNALGTIDLPAQLAGARTVIAEGAEREFTWRMRDKVLPTGLAGAPSAPGS